MKNRQEIDEKVTSQIISCNFSSFQNNDLSFKILISRVEVYENVCKANQV
jgi:hypothetical protein